MATGADEAFRTSRALPLWKWIRLDCYVEDSEVRTQPGSLLLASRGGALIGSIVNDGSSPDGKLGLMRFRIISSRAELLLTSGVFIGSFACWVSCEILWDLQVRLDTTWDNKTIKHVYQ